MTININKNSSKEKSIETIENSLSESISLIGNLSFEFEQYSRKMITHYVTTTNPFQPSQTYEN